MLQPIKVAVIGGGCASVTTAFELTRPEHNGRYEVTLYQVGWRLGGKGASGRGPADRIEEHGLHLWMGFYENAFQLLRECYRELGRDPATCRIADWRNAFEPDNFCGVMDRAPDGRWLPWVVHFPSCPGLPGDPGARRWTAADYLGRSITLLRTLLEAVRMKAGLHISTTPASNEGPTASPDQIAATISRLLRYGQLAGFGALNEALRLFQSAVEMLPRVPSELILQFHEGIAAAVRSQIEALIARDDEIRRLWEIVDLVLAVIRGMVRFGLTTDARGFEAIDDYDCREWLRMNGASERSVDSAFLRALYDLAFAYEDGDVKRPRIAAGQALRGSVRAFFTYRGAFFWKMNAGMGDVVFAPFYEVLARRGVRFEFFHRLTGVRLSPAGQSPDDSRHVERLEFDVQAHVQKKESYRPLVDVRGLPCWPAAPDWDQLTDGQRLKREERDFESHWDRRRVATKTLEVSRDFDLVVLGVGIGAIPEVCRDLVASNPKWRTMVEQVKSVPTQAFQLWLRDDMKALGWTGDQTNLSGFVEPFDTWADMRQLIPEESFPTPVGSIAYFCSVLRDEDAAAGMTPDPADVGYPKRRREEVRQKAVEFLNRHIHHLWPAAVRREGGFRWDLLVDPAGQVQTKVVKNDESRFPSQFWTANVNPSDRYTLSLPGTLKHRISPLDNTYDNLTIAGDWTDCAFNEGCVEAAVMSGRLAAHAIAKSPRLEDIIGFDHP